MILRHSARLAALACSAGIMFAGCTSELDIQDLEGRVTSVGPVSVDENQGWTIDFTVTQLRGLPVDLVFDYRVDGGAWQRLAPCDDPEACSVIGSVRGLFTDEDGADTPHRVAWDASAAEASGEVELRFMVEEEPERAVIWP